MQDQMRLKGWLELWGRGMCMGARGGAFCTPSVSACYRGEDGAGAPHSAGLEPHDAGCMGYLTSGFFYSFEPWNCSSGLAIVRRGRRAPGGDVVQTVEASEATSRLQAWV